MNNQTFDKDALSILLEMEKNMSNNYSIAMNEASTDELYENFFDMFTSIKDMARDIYDLMNHFGWYQIENVSSSEVSKLSQKLQNEFDQIEE